MKCYEYQICHTSISEFHDRMNEIQKEGYEQCGDTAIKLDQANEDRSMVYIPVKRIAVQALDEKEKKPWHYGNKERVGCYLGNLGYISAYFEDTDEYRLWMEVTHSAIIDAKSAEAIYSEIGNMQALYPDAGEPPAMHKRKEANEKQATLSFWKRLWK